MCKWYPYWVYFKYVYNVIRVNYVVLCDLVYDSTGLKNPASIGNVDQIRLRCLLNVL